MLLMVVDFWSNLFFIEFFGFDQKEGENDKLFSLISFFMNRKDVDQVHSINSNSLQSSWLNSRLRLQVYKNKGM
jgi:hypothetical protein